MNESAPNKWMYAGIIGKERLEGDHAMLMRLRLGGFVNVNPGDMVYVLITGNGWEVIDVRPHDALEA